MNRLSCASRNIANIVILAPRINIMSTTTNRQKFLLIIGGPTAVGKTGMSIDLAKHYSTEILSADSRQVYQEMTIGTAKPSIIEMGQVAHHMIGHRSIHETYSAGQFVQDARNRLSLVFESCDLAIMTGGTGFYIKALIKALTNFRRFLPKSRVHWKRFLIVEG